MHIVLAQVFAQELQHRGNKILELAQELETRDQAVKQPKTDNDKVSVNLSIVNITLEHLH